MPAKRSQGVGTRQEPARKRRRIFQEAPTVARQLVAEELFHIFCFLQADSLFIVDTVSKLWYTSASNVWKKWALEEMPVLEQFPLFEPSSWKAFYLQTSTDGLELIIRQQVIRIVQSGYYQNALKRLKVLSNMTRRNHKKSYSADSADVQLLKHVHYLKNHESISRSNARLYRSQVTFWGSLGTFATIDCSVYVELGKNEDEDCEKEELTLTALVQGKTIDLFFGHPLMEWNQEECDVFVNGMQQVLQYLQVDLTVMELWDVIHRVLSHSPADSYSTFSVFQPKCAVPSSQ